MKMPTAANLYLRSPVWAQQAIVAVWGCWWYRRRFGPRFERLLDGYRSRDRWTRAQFEAYQDGRLAELLAAARRSPYYRDVMAAAGITPAMDVRSALERFPILEKRTLQSKGTELFTAPAPPKGTKIFRSSGTTGTPTEIYSTPEFHAHQTAVRAARNQEWAGVAYDARRVMFGVRKICRFDQRRPPFWRYSPAEDLAYASIYHLSPEFLPSYIRFLRRFQPAIIMGCPSALNTIAQFSFEQGEPLAPARGVFTTCETVTDEARASIERAWQCRIFDQYGAVEACVFASQCEHGRYHLSPEIGIVEIVDADGRPCPPGVMGELVCTGIQNTFQPLIRYRIGDMARWSAEQSCPCGREMPIVEAFEGRFEDVCCTPDGRRLLRFDSVFKGVPHIREAQIVQEQLDRFVIRVVPAPRFGDPEAAALVSNMRLHVGDCRIDVERVPEIARTRSGKFRAVVCRLSADEKIPFATIH